MEVRDEKGERMSKTKQTAIPFDEAAEKMGVDVMRWMYLSQNPSLNLNFGFQIGDETRRRFHLLLWNIYNFFVTYANVDRWRVRKSLPSKPTKLDLWILTRLNETIVMVTKSLNEYNTPTATQAIESFVQDLSTWYLRRSRQRMGPTASNKKDKNLAYSVLYTVLITLAKVLAPFIPFLAEEIYQNLTGEESVHLIDWPEVKSREVLDEELLAKMELVRKICELGHAARKKAKIKVRQPLYLIKVQSRQPLYLIKVQSRQPLYLIKELVQLIKEELNVKEVVFKEGKGELRVELDTKITPELKKEGEARELVRQVQELRKKAGCQLDEKVTIFSPGWPKELEEYIRAKTLAKKIVKAKKLAVKKE
jgi:isoleucyl-tRNA synthetase